MQHFNNNKACVRYYYLPARNNNSAEVIEVLNSQHYSIDVPVWEEDIILEPFHTRTITPKEEQLCKGSEIWKLFSDWKKLYADHQKYGVAEDEVMQLENFKDKLQLSENIVA